MQIPRSHHVFYCSTNKMRQQIFQILRRFIPTQNVIAPILNGVNVTHNPEVRMTAILGTMFILSSTKTRQMVKK
jgi:uncharacterized membrane protein